MDVLYVSRILMTRMKKNKLLFYRVPSLMVVLQRKKKKEQGKKRGIGKKSKQRRVAGQARCCILHRRERARNAIR